MSFTVTGIQPKLERNTFEISAAQSVHPLLGGDGVVGGARTRIHIEADPPAHEWGRV